MALTEYIYPLHFYFAIMKLKFKVTTFDFSKSKIIFILSKTSQNLKCISNIRQAIFHSTVPLSYFFIGIFVQEKVDIRIFATVGVFANIRANILNTTTNVWINMNDSHSTA